MTEKKAHILMPTEEDKYASEKAVGEKARKLRKINPALKPKPIAKEKKKP